MMDRIHTYRIQVENWPQDQDIGAVRRGFQGRGRGRGVGPGRRCGQVNFYNCGKEMHFVRDCTNPTHLSCQYCRQFDHMIGE